MTDSHEPDVYGQEGFACRFDWGLRGTRAAAERGDVIVIVDVLSFSSTTVTGIGFGAEIYPFPMWEGAEAYAREVGAELRYGAAIPRGSRALSPLLFTESDRGKKFVLRSPNGATCAKLAPQVPALFAGCLLNAGAVAQAARSAAASTGAAITVIACGEQWKDAQEYENRLRPSLEDSLGAGAILAAQAEGRSPEADMCAQAFQVAQARVADLIWECASGRELRACGFGDDVRYCGRLNVLAAVPQLIDSRFVGIDV